MTPGADGTCPGRGKTKVASLLGAVMTNPLLELSEKLRILEAVKGEVCGCAVRCDFGRAEVTTAHLLREV